MLSCDQIKLVAAAFIFDTAVSKIQRIKQFTFILVFEGQVGNKSWLNSALEKLDFCCNEHFYFLFEDRTMLVRFLKFIFRTGSSTKWKPPTEAQTKYLELLIKTSLEVRKLMRAGAGYRRRAWNWKFRIYVRTSLFGNAVDNYHLGIRRDRSVRNHNVGKLAVLENRK